MNQPKKIAIVGGGCAAMSAAFEITNASNWQDDYEVTVYQMGWRLGGKGAAGRNHDKGSRIEEHGFHVWMGFYNNAFRLIRAAYEDADRPLGAGLQNFEDAFHPHSYIVLEEELGGPNWANWGLHLPPNNLSPGEGEPPTILEFLVRGLAQGIELLTRHEIWDRVRNPRAVPFFPPYVRKVLARLGELEHALDVFASDAVLGLARIALRLLELLDRMPITGRPLHLAVVVWLLKTFKSLTYKALKDEIETEIDVRRFWILFDFGTSTLIGMVADGVLTRGYSAIDHLDFREWLIKNGITPITAESATIRVCYDLTFGFRQGNTKYARFCAGSGLFGLLNLFMGYKGAVMWKMMGGMGDTIFGPLYQVLLARGVQFKFFHKITDVRANDAHEVVAIDVDQQAATVGGVPYDPLVTVRNLQGWPSEPLWDQLVDGPAMKAAGVNFESWWNTRPPASKITLTKGKDFDLVVLGTSVAPLKYIASDLMKRHRPFHDMVMNVATTETMGVQLWAMPTRTELGWQHEPAIIGAYTQPLDTIADMSDLIPHEDWGSVGLMPRSLQYLCGPMECPDWPPLDDPTYPATKLALVQATASEWLDEHATFLWPGGAADDGPAFDRGLLAAPAGSTDDERFAYQFFRANVDPDQRYVLTLPGTNRYRLRSDGSGFRNLYLAGDFTATPFNAGCVEAAVISGLMASQAICGRPAVIFGDELFQGGGQ